MLTNHRFFLLAAVVGSMAACDSATLGLPREALSVQSPDGAFRAVVRNHPSLDPPRQSLWLYDRQGSPRLVRTLAEDQDWCRTVAWAGDSRRVAFLVQDIQAIVVDATTGEVLVAADLAPRRDYPPDRMATDVRLSRDGKILSFRVCTRDGSDCDEPAFLEIGS